MSLTTGQTILKDNSQYSSPGIVQALMSSDFIGNEYACGYHFNDSSTLPYYSSENIVLVYLDSALVDKNFNSSLFCQTSSYSKILNKTSILNSVSENKNANFNDLSTMIFNAFVPLTNIRKSKFSILTQSNDGTYGVKDITANVFLTNESIRGNASLPAFMQNKANNKIVIATAAQFISRGGILSELRDIKNDSIQQSYSASSSTYISANILNRLFDCCLSALNKIRMDLSCLFEDEGDDKFKKELIYHSSNSGGEEYRSSHFINSTISIPDFKDVFPSTVIQNFQGWTLTKNSKNVNYNVGDEIVITQNLDLYPVIPNQANIIYEDSTASSIVSAGTSNNDTALEGTIYTVKGIEDPGGTRLAYRSGDLKTAYSSLFKGYAYSENSGVAVTAGSNIVIEAKDYYLYPKFDTFSRTLKLDKGTGWKHFGRNETKYFNMDLDIDLRVDLSLFKSMTVIYTGWVNEMYQTHPCNIYLAKISVGTYNILNNDQLLFSYSAGNGWSWERQPLTPYEAWPKISKTYGPFNIPSNSEQQMKFSFKVQDSFKEEKSGSEGAVFVGQVILYP